MVKFLGRQSILWSICFNIWVIWGACWILVQPLQAGWLSGYAHRKALTFGTVDGGPHTHFPVWISRTDSDIDDVCGDDGIMAYDLRFTTSDGATELDIDPIAYSEAGGEAIFKLFTSQSGWAINDGTVFYCYYGNDAAGDPDTDDGVWDANYIFVLHFEEAAGTLYDSADGVTSHDSTAENLSNYQQAGKLNYALEFDGANDYVTLADNAEFTNTEVTVELWHKNTSWTENDYYFAWYDSTSNDGIRILQYGADPNEYIRCYFRDDSDETVMTDALNIAMDTWYHYAITRDTGDDVTAYVNGVAQADVESCAGTMDSSDALEIGQNNSSTGRVDAFIEEVRFSNSERSADWLAFQYDNANEADNEIAWGAEQNPPSYIPKVIIIGGHGCTGLCLVIFRRRKQK